MAELSEAEARLVIATASEPGDHRVVHWVNLVGAVNCELESGVLPAPVQAKLDRSVLNQLDRFPDCRWVIPGDPEWPPGMVLLGDSQPLGLWVRGQVPLEPQLAVSVVGARSATQYGEYVASELAAGLAGEEVLIVSGGAYGIDAAAHRGALAVRGTTVAVLAGGVDVPYPRTNHQLFERILETGALVSEVPLGLAPVRHRFLIRNRLIAAWSRATVVVEARERSGAVNTATQAGTIGREVLAVPGPVTSAASVGCHQLIRDGATLVMNAEEVLQAIGRR